MSPGDFMSICDIDSANAALRRIVAERDELDAKDKDLARQQAEVLRLRAELCKHARRRVETSCTGEPRFRRRTNMQTHRVTCCDCNMWVDDAECTWGDTRLYYGLPYHAPEYTFEVDGKPGKVVTR